jgi:hypothetical protein
MSGGGDHGQVFLHFQTETLKDAQFFEQFPFKTKHSFFGGHLLCNRLSVCRQSWFQTAGSTRQMCFLMFTRYWRVIHINRGAGRAGKKNDLPGTQAALRRRAFADLEAGETADSNFVG